MKEKAKGEGRRAKAKGPTTALALRTRHLARCALPWLTVLPLVAADPDSGLEAIPPLPPPHGEIPPGFWEQNGWWVLSAGAALLVAGAVIGLWLLVRAKPPPVIVPPEVRARQALDGLREHAETGALLSLVSQVMRQYVIQAFGLPPGELTTTEFCRAVGSKAPVGPELSAALSEFLRQCDQRKFAPAPPLPPLGAVSRACGLVDKAEARRAQLRQAAATQPPRLGRLSGTPASLSQ